MNEDELRGAQKLIEEAVHETSAMIERVQKGAAKRTFDVLGALPPIAPFSGVVQTLHDASVSATHSYLRWVNGVVHRSLDAVVQVVRPTKK